MCGRLRAMALALDDDRRGTGRLDVYDAFGDSRLGRRGRSAAGHEKSKGEVAEHPPMLRGPAEDPSLA